MLSNWVVRAGAASALALAGCGASGVQFSGSRQPAVTAPEGVEQGAHPPPDAKHLGRVRAECEPLAPDQDVEGVRVSALSCSSQLLRAALREAAADAGGSFLAQPECEEKRDGDGARARWIGCEGEVWGPAQAETKALAVAAPFESARDAWQITVDFWPAPAAQRGAARDIESVAEVDFPRVGQRPLGDLTARCESGCAQGSLQRGLRAAAAWLGASTLVGVRCIHQERALVCTGSISAPEHDEVLAGVP